MKRRKFFKLATTGAAGLTMAASCTNQKKDTGSGISEVDLPKDVPSYKNSQSPSIPSVPQRSANDRLTVALIGAGHH
ncbi:MAG: hypothetical protein V3V53_07725, partial [Bacteroidales bacterium]